MARAKRRIPELPKEFKFKVGDRVCEKGSKYVYTIIEQVDALCGLAYRMAEGYGLWGPGEEVLYESDLELVK